MKKILSSEPSMLTVSGRPTFCAASSRPFAEAYRHGGDVIDTFRGQVAHRHGACRHAERIAVEGAGMIDDQFVRIEQPHVLAAPAHCADGKSTADELAEHGQVRRYAQYLLQAAGRHAKRLHFIEHEHRAGFTRRSDDVAQEFGARGQHAACSQHRLEEHPGDILAVHLQLLAKACCVVEASDLRTRARLIHRAELKLLDDAVIAEPRHQQFLPPSRGTCDMQGEIGRFAAGVGETNLVDRGDALHDLPGEVDLVHVVRGPCRALGRFGNESPPSPAGKRDRESTTCSC